MAEGGWKEVEGQVTTREDHELRSNDYDFMKENNIRKSCVLGHPSDGFVELPWWVITHSFADNPDLSPARVA